MSNEDLLDVREFVQHRYNQSITSIHLLAYLLHPSYNGENLSREEREQAEEWLRTRKPDFIPLFLSFLAKDAPFPASRFDQHALQTPAATWWRAMSRTPGIDASFAELAVQLVSIPASSASIERIFSTFGLVLSKARNRLGIERAAKLVFCYRHLSVEDPEDG